jgi:hypothetical protein
MSLTLRRQSNTGMIDVQLSSPMGAWSMRWMRRVPVDNPVAIEFVRRSSYTLRFIVHPNGGNAMRMVCDTCAADYPFSWTMQKFSPCANCAVRRQWGFRVRLGGWKWEQVTEV